MLAFLFMFQTYTSKGQAALCEFFCCGHSCSLCSLFCIGKHHKNRPAPQLDSTDGFSRVSSMRSFKLTNLTCVHFLLSAMLSHVVFKLLHTAALLTTVSTFIRFFCVHSILVQSQFDIVRKIFSTLVTMKLSPLHFNVFVQLIKRLIIRSGFHLSPYKVRWKVKGPIVGLNLKYFM